MGSQAETKRNLSFTNYYDHFLRNDALLYTKIVDTGKPSIMGDPVLK